jgi:hypothetical protein
MQSLAAARRAQAGRRAVRLQLGSPFDKPLDRLGALSLSKRLRVPSEVEGEPRPPAKSSRAATIWTDNSIVFAIATIILLLAVPMMAIVKGYAGSARMCRPARSARGSSTVCTQAIE